MVWFGEKWGRDQQGVCEMVDGGQGEGLLSIIGKQHEGTAKGAEEVGYKGNERFQRENWKRKKEMKGSLGIS